MKLIDLTHRCRNVTKKAKEDGFEDASKYLTTTLWMTWVKKQDLLSKHPDAIIIPETKPGQRTRYWGNEKAWELLFDFLDREAFFHEHNLAPWEGTGAADRTKYFPDKEPAPIEKPLENLIKEHIAPLSDDQIIKAEATLKLAMSYHEALSILGVLTDSDKQEIAELIRSGIKPSDSILDRNIQLTNGRISHLRPVS